MTCPEPFVLEEDRCRYAIGLRVVDQMGHLLEGDFDPKGHQGCRHEDTPEWKAAHRPRKVKPMEDIQPSPPPVIEVSHDVGAPAVPTTALTGVADALPFDLTKVLPADGVLSTPAVVLGGLAITGGVLLKVVPAWLKSRAEMAAQRLALKARRLELEQKSKEAEKAEGSCEARHAACAASVAALVERVQLVERQVDGLASALAGSRDEATKLALRSGKDDVRLAAVEARLDALVKASEGNKSDETST